MLLRTLVLALSVALMGSIINTVHANEFDDATVAYSQGDYAKAIELWRFLATGGNADAQRILGSMYANGNGVRQDYIEAVGWFIEASLQGDIIAQENLNMIMSSSRQ